MKIVLVGMMGSGKTTVGKMLADKLGLPFIDMDAEIEMRIGMTVNDIFSARGEKFFRFQESELAAGLINYHGVISTGGGVLFTEGNTELLQQGNGIIIYLHLPLSELENRLTGDKRRPLLKSGKKAIAEILDRRDPVYREEADIIIDASAKKPEIICKEIIDRI